MADNEEKRRDIFSVGARVPVNRPQGARLSDYVQSVSHAGRVQPVASLSGDHDSEPLVRALNVGVGACSFFLNLLIRHPFVVMRRQCQINNVAPSPGFRIAAPFSTMTVMWRLQRDQGARCLWKGMSSANLATWLEAACQGIIVAASPCPRTLGDTRLKQLPQYFAMRCACTVLSLPFYSASLLETVQSQVTSDGDPSAWDFVQQGLCRVVGRTPHFSRRNLIPLWTTIAAPALLHAILRDVIATGVRSLTLRLYNYFVPNQHALSSSADAQPATGGVARSSSQSTLTTMQHLANDMQADAILNQLSFPELLASVISRLAAAALLFPLETVLHRLHVQGTRLIVDNVDSGLGIVPHDSAYLGFWHCVRTIRSEEGMSGFYKGFSALLLQIGAELLLLHITRISFAQVNSGVFHSTPSPAAAAKPVPASQMQG